ncbi:hypothetical protein OHB08_12180 [Streptomyces phaeochromogenes]|nr:hypothetical protein OHB08_12180 [Streptomyces phaeochromogenes]
MATVEALVRQRRWQAGEVAVVKQRRTVEEFPKHSAELELLKRTSLHPQPLVVGLFGQPLHDQRPHTCQPQLTGEQRARRTATDHHYVNVNINVHRYVSLLDDRHL